MLFRSVALAEILVAFIGFGVWVHHMFTVGLATITTVYFAAASLIIVIPSAIQLFAWITTILTGTPDFKTPLLFIIGRAFEAFSGCPHFPVDPALLAIVAALGVISRHHALRPAYH